jgi:hypothetical protein
MTPAIATDPIGLAWPPLALSIAPSSIPDTQGLLGVGQPTELAHRSPGRTLPGTVLHCPPSHLSFAPVRTERNPSRPAAAAHGGAGHSIKLVCNLQPHHAAIWAFQQVPAARQR